MSVSAFITGVRQLGSSLPGSTERREPEQDNTSLLSGLRPLLERSGSQVADVLAAVENPKASESVRQAEQGSIAARRRLDQQLQQTGPVAQPRLEGAYVGVIEADRELLTARTDRAAWRLQRLEQSLGPIVASNPQTAAARAEKNVAEMVLAVARLDAVQAEYDLARFDSQLSGDTGRVQHLRGELRRRDAETAALIEQYNARVGSDRALTKERLREGAEEQAANGTSNVMRQLAASVVNWFANSIAHSQAELRRQTEHSQQIRTERKRQRKKIDTAQQNEKLQERSFERAREQRLDRGIR